MDIDMKENGKKIIVMVTALRLGLMVENMRVSSYLIKDKEKVF